MSVPGLIAVIDIGKTNAKVALVDLSTRSEVAVRRRPNTVLTSGPYPHYDIDGLWTFILSSLSELGSTGDISAITVTTHGASAALLDASGNLVAPVLDYEHDGPDSTARRYDAVRPAFEETGSPRLALGLNLGAQLFWQFDTFPDIRRDTRTIVTYPQYWVFRLTGRAVNEVTSLGCHTDLWCPAEARFSSLVEAQGWSALMAPLAKATDQIGTLLPEVAEACGLPSGIPVYGGIHDSNASLFAHIVSRKAPFAVVSTGTWVISMAIGGQDVTLDPARDTLINVNAFTEPVPSARFMGGREFETINQGRAHQFDACDIDEVLRRRAMLLPSVEQRSGPYPGRAHQWTVEEATLSDGERYVALSFYLALMTVTGLEIAGALGEILVEGPFGDNRAYLDMLASASGRPVRAVAGTGTSIGAAMLTRPRPATPPAPSETPARSGDGRLADYANLWREQVKTAPHNIQSD